MLLSKVPEIDVKPLFLNFCNFAHCEKYLPGKKYDVVFAYNLSPELEAIKKYTDMKVFGIAVEPKSMWSHNYNQSLIDCCDVYMCYSDYSGKQFDGEFVEFVYPAATRKQIAESFERSIQCERVYDFGIFARHDPNIRTEIGEAIKPLRSLLGGGLFNNWFKDKFAAQRQIKFEFITENDLTENYVSEKLGQSILSGCVPIYLGAPRAKRLFPRDMFVDMSEFESVADVISYCRKPGVYESHFQRISEHAKTLISESHSWEGCIFDPLRDYVFSLSSKGFAAHSFSPYWQLRQYRHWLGRKVRHVRF